MSEENSLKNEISKIMKTRILQQSFNKQAVQKMEIYLIKYIKELVTQAFKRNLRRDHQSNSLQTRDIVYLIEQNTKAKTKIVKALIQSVVYKRLDQTNVGAKKTGGASFKSLIQEHIRVQGFQKTQIDSSFFDQDNQNNLIQEEDDQ